MVCCAHNVRNGRHIWCERKSLEFSTFTTHITRPKTYCKRIHTQKNGIPTKPVPAYRCFSLVISLVLSQQCGLSFYISSLMERPTTSNCQMKIIWAYYVFFPYIFVFSCWLANIIRLDTRNRMLAWFCAHCNNLVKTDDIIRIALSSHYHFNTT